MQIQFGLRFPRVSSTQKQLKTSEQDCKWIAQIFKIASRLWMVFFLIQLSKLIPSLGENAEPYKFHSTI